MDHPSPAEETLALARDWLLRLEGVEAARADYEAALHRYDVLNKQNKQVALALVNVMGRSTLPRPVVVDDKVLWVQSEDTIRVFAQEQS